MTVPKPVDIEGMTIAELRAYSEHLDAEKARLAPLIRASAQAETMRRRARIHRPRRNDAPRGGAE